MYQQHAYSSQKSTAPPTDRGNMAANECSRERVIYGEGAFIRRLPYEASRGFAPCHRNQ